MDPHGPWVTSLQWLHSQSLDVVLIFGVGGLTFFVAKNAHSSGPVIWDSVGGLTVFPCCADQSLYLSGPWFLLLNVAQRTELNLCCWGPAPAGSRGTLRMKGVGEWERDRERDRERERERERERDQTTRPGCAAESGNCFIFHHSLYTLSRYISKGEISIQT